MVAMISATVMASGTARCTRLAATVMPVKTSSAAPIIRYLRTLFLTSAGSECMLTLPNCGPPESDTRTLTADLTSAQTARDDSVA